MNRASAWSLILAMVVAGLSAAGHVHASDAVVRTDFSGTWLLDLDHSDHPGRPGGPPPGMGPGGPDGGPPGGMAGGPHGGTGSGPPGGMSGGGPEGHGGPPSGGEGGPEATRGRGPAMRLPHRMHVTQTAQRVSFEDSTGAVVREIVITVAEADTFMHAPMADVVHGRWNKQKLETQRPGRFDTPIVETYTVEGNGKRLVIRTELPGNEQMPARTLKRVYGRAEK